MKNVFLILLALGISRITYGQEFGKTDIGVKGGPSFTNIGGETDNKMKTGAHLGVYAEAMFMDQLHFQLEILLSGQGHAPAATGGAKLKLTYLNIPILAKFYPTENISVQAGPQFGFLMSAKSESSGITYDMKDSFKGFDLGFLLGAGYDFRLIERNMNVGLRYIHGITNIAKDSGQSRFNRVLQLSLAVQLFEVVQ